MQKLTQIDAFLADIVVGWVAFMLPWSVLVLGSYGGNLLRP